MAATRPASPTVKKEWPWQTLIRQIHEALDHIFQSYIDAVKTSTTFPVITLPNGDTYKFPNDDLRQQFLASVNENKLIYLDFLFTKELNKPPQSFANIAALDTYYLDEARHVRSTIKAMC